jgi:preprotein translocase subunit SecG
VEGFSVSAGEIAFGIILMIFAVGIIVVVLLQEGHEQNVGVITGGADTFLSKNRARSVDAFLARWTKMIAIGFFVLVILMNAYMFFFLK